MVNQTYKTTKHIKKKTCFVCLIHRRRPWQGDPSKANTLPFKKTMKSVPDDCGIRERELKATIDDGHNKTKRVKVTLTRLSEKTFGNTYDYIIAIPTI